MPNVNKPSGLTPVKYLGGADWDGRGNVYSIDSANTSIFAPGDLVRLSGTGDANGIPGIVKSAAGDGATLGQGAVGVVLAVGTNPNGPWINPADLTAMVTPGSGKGRNYYALVADDPNIIFEVQELGTGTPLDQTAIGLNCNLSIANPATGTQVSGTMLDNATEAATLGLDVKLLGLARKPGNAFGAYAKWLVLINSHAYRAAITGI
ncbi:MAG: hypothetical protein SFV24_19115 [Gemmatimonadales bacterium]|nr:hypothetical protein [Gemmatimonadales bacterium]